MAPKSKPVGRSPVVILFLSVLIVCGQEGLAVNGQSSSGDGGKQFLDEKEADVVAIAGNATANNNDCVGLNTCSSSCSRVTCLPPIGGNKLLTCTTVDNNEHFNLCSRGSCNNTMLLDYTQSFVTLPAPALTANLQPEVANDICLQKPLDPTLKLISLPSAYTLVYFGSVSGAYRSFPGRELDQGQCTSYDPRRRPWYSNGISVNKDVKILVDVSVSMGKQVPIQYNQNIQYLNVAQNITRALLQTFSPGDFVEVLSFDSQGATSLTGAPVYIDASFDYTTPDRPELHDLIGNVSSLVASQNVSPSNLTGAIVKATQSFKPAKFSKVIIVLTDGQFAPVDAAFPTQTLVSSQTKLMIYKLDTFGTDEYLLNTTLDKAVCSVSGSFEVLDAQAIPNPLYAMRSYFTFLAQTQLVAANNKSTWTPLYKSTDQDLSVITVTFPAFGDDSQLIGVAGVDVVVTGLNETLQGLVLSNFVNRHQGILPVPATIPLTCSYQKAAATGYCSSSPTASSSAICQNIDNSISLAARTCCGDCGGGGGSNGLSKGAEAGIGIGAAVGALGLAVCGGLFLYNWYHIPSIPRTNINDWAEGNDKPGVPGNRGHREPLDIPRRGKRLFCGLI